MVIPHEKKQKKIKINLIICKCNSNKKSKLQIKRSIRYNRNIKNLYNAREEVIKSFNDYARIRSETMYKTKQGTGLS